MGHGPLIYFYNLLLPSKTLLLRASVVILLMLYFLLSVSGVPALGVNFRILSIYIQWSPSLFCWFYVLITIACFYLHLYIRMFLSFVKQHLRTVKFLDLGALRSFFMQVQYKRKILFHCYILVKSGQTPYNRSITEKDILTSLPISCNCLPCRVCAFCKDLYIKLKELLYNSHACIQDLLKHSKACIFYNQNGMWSFSKARFNKGAMIICKMCMDVRGDFY